MNKELKALWILIAIIGVIWFGMKAQAGSSDIDIIYPGRPAPIFNEANLAPGAKVTKQITIRNNASSTKDLAIQILNVDNSILAPYMTLSLSQNSVLIFSSSFADSTFPKESYIMSLAPGDTNFDLTSTLSESLDNKGQGQKISFDIKFGFIQKEAPTPTPGPLPTPTPTPTPTPSPIPGGGPIGGSLMAAARRALPSITGAAVAAPAPAVTKAEEAGAKKEGAVMGTEAVKSFWDKIKNLCLPWWLWLILLLIILILSYLYLRERRRRKQLEV